MIAPRKISLKPQSILLNKKNDFKTNPFSNTIRWFHKTPSPNFTTNVSAWTWYNALFPVGLFLERGNQVSQTSPEIGFFPKRRADNEEY